MRGCFRTFFFLALFILTKCDGELCTTIFENLGTCQPLNECDEIADLLKLSTYALRVSIQKSILKTHCGFVGKIPKICCPIPAVTPFETPNSYTPLVVTTKETPLITKVETNQFASKMELLPTQCGESTENRIFYGNHTGIFDFPWMALLSYRNTTTGKNSFRCGGSILNNKYILTAAHCIYTRSDLVLEGVRVGDHDLWSDIDCEGPKNALECADAPQNLKIEKTSVPPEYSGAKHDIALIRLDKPIDFNRNNIDAICLPLDEKSRFMNTDNLSMTVAGWGKTEQKIRSPRLLRADLPIQNNEKCADNYLNLMNELVLIDGTQICAGGDKSDSCVGDSGGPLMFMDRNDNKIKQFGIVSYGPKKCGTVGVPGVYTRVSSYIEWILNELQP